MKKSSTGLKTNDASSSHVVPRVGEWLFFESNPSKAILYVASHLREESHAPLSSDEEKDVAADKQQLEVG